jgi:hypothetical protein
MLSNYSPILHETASGRNDYFLNDYSLRLPKTSSGRNESLIYQGLDFSLTLFLPVGNQGEININKNRDFQLPISHPLRGGFLSGSNPAPRRIGATAPYAPFRLEEEANAFTQEVSLWPLPVCHQKEGRL